MSFYRVTIPVILVVEINGENVQADPRPALKGNTPLIAVRRAIWCLFAKEPQVERKRLGVKRMFINGRWENMDVAELKADFANRPFAPDALMTDP